MSLASWMLRAVFALGDRKRDAGCTTPADVRRWDDLVYGPDPRWNRLDVYRPRDAEGPLPVIVSVHGGGWVYGDKEGYQYYCMSLAQQGFGVVNFSYRLAPRHRFPAQLEDTARAFGWVRDHARQYGLDVRNLFGVGDSAGAHLLAMYCCLGTNPAYGAQLPVQVPADGVPRAVALNCGVYWLHKDRGRNLTSMLLGDYLPGRGTAAELELLDLPRYLTGGFPPAFVMTAEGDFLAGQAGPLVRQLRALGVEAEYHCYGDKDHPLHHVFHCDSRSAEARRCNREECTFFRKHRQP